MARIVGGIRRNRRGQALAMVAVSMVVVIAVGALAVDLGMAFAARAAAQRAADSAALAGASTFIDFSYTDPDAVDEATARAMEYAISNDILAEPIDQSQVTVWVLPAEQKVRVRIEETGLPTWFARVLNIFSMDVAAVAAAVASEGGSADKCVLPFAIPDLWWDKDDDDGNFVPDGDEEWEFDEGDEYSPYQSENEGCDGGQGCDGIGLGSNFRDADGIESDLGRRIWIKTGPIPSDSAGGMDVSYGPGNFLLWQMPDPEGGCESKPGAQWVRQNILECNTCPITVGEEYEPEEFYETQTGNVASIKAELLELIDSDLGAQWDEESQTVVGGGGEDSPRVRIVPLWSPAVYDPQGHSNVRFINLAKIFIEGGGTYPPEFAVSARFMGFVDTGGGGSPTGSLIKYLRLVE